MPLIAFELACVAVVGLTLRAMAGRGARALLVDYACLALAAWIGEDTCVALYRYYAYAEAWHLRLHHVPVLVPLIWPLVILSARDVVAAIARPSWPPYVRGLAVAMFVVFDASLVEVIAVRAGLWSWSEGGHLGVPVIGILGWGYFAFGADLALARGRPLAAIVVAPLVAHGLILGTWWVLFRWALRGPLGAASVLGVLAIGAAALVLAVVARRSGAAIPLRVAAPRMIAALLFFVLLVTTAPGDGALWLHTLAVAAPYFAATELRLVARQRADGATETPGTRSPAGPLEPRAPSRR
ncbi:MAG: hypothetical protein JST00_02310 [Deltaproteobacteria bacterium]|nr:hypothetical protein [Deltaproteobacteria bacterium]